MNAEAILNKIKNHYGFKKDTGLARHLDISPQTLSNWKKRNSYDPQVIYAKCPEINPEWLMTGKGFMLKSEYLHHSKNLPSIRDKEHPLPRTEKIPSIPLYDLESEMGLEDVLKKDSSKAIILNFIKIPHFSNCDGAAYVKGNSMTPLLKNGDIVLFKGMPLKDLFWGEMYLMEIALDNESSFLTIKYLHKSELGEEFVRLVSENPDHEPKDMPIDKIKAAALIRASIRPH